MVDNYRAMFESIISREEQKNFHSLKIFIFLHGPMMWKVMQRNVWSDIASWRTRRLNNSTEHLLHALMRELESVRELSNVCSQNCSEMLKLGTYWKT